MAHSSHQSPAGRRKIKEEGVGGAKSCVIHTSAMQLYTVDNICTCILYVHVHVYYICIYIFLYIHVHVHVHVLVKGIGSRYKQAVCH